MSSSASRHPDEHRLDHFSFCQFAAPVERMRRLLTGRNAVAIRPGKIDRSPTGTGALGADGGAARARRDQVGERFVGRRSSARDSTARSKASRGSATPRRSSRESPAAPGSPAPHSLCSIPTTPIPPAIASPIPGRNCEARRFGCGTARRPLTPAGAIGNLAADAGVAQW